MPVEQGYSQQVYLQENQKVRSEPTPGLSSPVTSHETSFYRKFEERGNHIIKFSRLADSSPFVLRGGPETSRPLPLLAACFHMA
jgi:hypothetical protein